LERVVRWAGLSVNSFALSIGLSRAENLYQIKRGHNGISRELAAMISEKYPQISRAWLLTGEGDMFVGQMARQSRIPFYEVDIEKYIAGPGRFRAEGWVSLPDPRGAEFAARYRGRAMGGEIPDGAMVLVRKVTPGEVTAGGAYLVVAEGLALLRRVTPDTGAGVLRLTAPGAEGGDEIRLAWDDVREIYEVCTIIIDKTG
jgi:hypothetical protein